MAELSKSGMTYPSVEVILHVKKRLIVIYGYFSFVKSHQLNLELGKFMFHLDTFRASKSIEINQKYPEDAIADPSKAFSQFNRGFLVSVIPVLSLPHHDQPNTTIPVTTLRISLKNSLECIPWTRHIKDNFLLSDESYLYDDIEDDLDDLFGVNDVSGKIQSFFDSRSISSMKT